MALIKSRGSIVDQDQNYCVLTSLCYRHLYVYKNIIFSFLFIRYIAFYFAVITKTQLFKRAKHCVKWLGFQGCHLATTERGLSQTTSLMLGLSGLQTFTWFLGVGHAGIKQICPLSKQSDAWKGLEQMNLEIIRKWDVIRYC